MTTDRLAEAQRRHQLAEAARVQATAPRTGLWARFNEHVHANNEVAETLRDTREGVRVLAGLLHGARIEIGHLGAMVELQRTHSAAMERRVRLLEELLVSNGVVTELELEDAADDTEDRASAINDVHNGYWDLNRAIDRYLGHVPESVLLYVAMTPPERRTPEALAAAWPE